MEENWCSRFMWLQNIWLNMNFGYLSLIAYIQNSRISFTQHYFVLKHFGQCKNNVKHLSFYFLCCGGFLSLEVTIIYLIVS